jgi:hypothetical protein
MKKSIQFTSEQFRTLLELVYLGDQVVNGHKVDRIEGHDELLKYLFSMAKQFKLENVSLDDDPKYPTADLDKIAC